MTRPKSHTATGPSDAPDRRVAIWLAVIAGLYLVASLAVVLGYNSPVVDEPIFASSAWEFARSGEIQISNLSAPNAVFDTVWGGLFAMFFGETYEALRVSTIVLTAISGPFVYLLCQTLGASRGTSVIGVAAYFFAPLAFPLSITFQTDSHFLALAVMAISVTAYGLTRETNQTPFLVLGSGFTALAFLSRPQALLIPMAVMLVWLFGRGARPKLPVGVAAVIALPAVTFAAHTFWTKAVGEPYIRGMYWDRITALNPKTYAVIGSQALVDGVIFVGLFALPFLPLLLPAVRRAIGSHERLAVYLGAGLGTITIGLLATGQAPLLKGAWVGLTGLGAVDRSFLGSRPSFPFWLSLVAITAAASATYALVLASSQRDDSVQRRAGFLFVVLASLGFVGGALISTLGTHGRILDRYWLPLLPLVIALCVSVSRTSRLVWVSSSVVALLGLVSVVGSVDALTVYEAANTYSDELVSEGMDPLSLDGGASWSAATFGLNDQNPGYQFRVGPYWVKFYAVDSDPEYAISLSPLEGYEVLERREYRSILHPGPDYFYLVHRDPALPFYVRQSDL